METVGVSAGVFGEQYYTTGLLHSIGKLVINSYHTQHGIPGYQVMDGPLTYERELKLLGFSNADVAGAILQQWNFPSDVRIPIFYKYRPMLAPCHRCETVTLNLVRKIMHIIEDGEEPYDVFEVDEEIIAETQTSVDVFVGSAKTGHGLANRLLSIVSEN